MDRHRAILHYHYVLHAHPRKQRVKASKCHIVRCPVRIPAFAPVDEFGIAARDPGVTRRYAEFIDWSEGGDPDRATNYVTFRRFHPLLARVRVKYVVVVEYGAMTVHSGAGSPLGRGGARRA